MGALPFDDATTGRYLGWIRTAAFVLLVIGLCGFLIDGANRPANPKLVPGPKSVPSSGTPSPSGLRSFGVAYLTVSPGPGSTVPAGRPCALVARAAGQQDEGLMGQTSLHPTYSPGVLYRYAMVPKGMLAPIGISEGSSIQVGGPAPFEDRPG